MRKILIITLLAGLIAITGCSSTTSSNTANNNTNADKLSQDAAISLALADVGVSNEEVSNISIKYDSENGKTAYEIEFYCNDKEYDYTIDAITGDIINSQLTIASYNASSVASATTDNTNNTDSNNVKDSNQSSNNTNLNESNNASDIGLEKAKSIALSQVSGASASNIIKAKRDYDDGTLEYEIEIVYGDYEYDFEIRASDGKIIGSDQESIYD